MTNPFQNSFRILVEMLGDVGALDLESFLRFKAGFHRPGYSAALLLAGKRDIEYFLDVDRSLLGLCTLMDVK